MAEFDEFDQHTLYHPYATSLRMSDIGYKSKNQASLEIDYNSLSGYVESLSHAIETPYPEYEKIGVKVDGQYKQLNANILQIENEFYSTVRPKQIAESCEKPTLALKRRGVKYIEIRSLDLDIFDPIGIDESKSRFIEAFLLNCLLHPSPEYTDQEQKINNDNQLAVAHSGRKPGLELNNDGQQITLKTWANDILHSMHAVCEILDKDSADKPYSKALKQQTEVVKNPELTPSAKTLQGMRSNKQPFGCFGLKTSERHKQHFKQHRLDSRTTQEFDQMATVSHDKQLQIEADDRLSFDAFLERYFSQN
jgi:glutamate--cysteine ligase